MTNRQHHGIMGMCLGYVCAIAAVLLCLGGTPSLSADPPAGVKPGDTVAEVIAIMGNPKGRLKQGRALTYVYDRGVVDFVDGLVTRTDLSSARATDPVKSERTPAEEKSIPSAGADQRQSSAGQQESSGRQLGQGMTTTTPANRTSPDPDWPQWRGPDRTGVAQHSPPLASAWPDRGPKKVWEAHPVQVTSGAYAGGHGCPVVARGRAYMFIHDKAKNQEMVVCLSAQTGSTIWIQKFTSRETMHGASATPCVVEGRLYVTGARVSYCLDAITGTELWRQDTGVPAKDPTVNRANQEVSSSFIVVSDIAATMLGPCYGLNTQTGRTVWTAPESGGYSGTMTSPMRWLHNGKAYLVYCGMWRMCCVEADNGSVFWDVPGNNTGKGYAPTPALAGDDLAVYWRGKFGAYHLTEAGPQLLWETKYFDPYSSPILDNGRVYVAGRQQDDKNTSLTCYDLATGTPRWVCSIPDPQYSSPILADGKLIVLGDKGKRLILVDALTGKQLANVPINGKLWSSPAFANGLLYVRLANDGLACYDLISPRS